MARSVRYVPGQQEPFKMSRAKIEDFIRCPRCFVLEVKHGIKKPTGVPFTLNVAVDNLLKKEFDTYRANGAAHPIAIQNGLNLKPFQHPDLDTWRNNFKGVTAQTEDGKFLITGAVDDIWVDDAGTLYVIDYKATGRQEAVTSLGEGGFYDGYRRQLEIYQWLLRKNGFTVSDTGYWVYVTATQKQDSFDNNLKFEANLVSYTGSDQWIDSVLDSIYTNLNEPEVPGPGDDCDLCRFFEERANKAIEWHELVWKNCGDCGTRMLKTIYGMMAGEAPSGHISMGCIVDAESPEWLCPKCDLEEEADLTLLPRAE